MTNTSAARLEVAGRLGITACVDISREGAAVAVKRLMDGVGVGYTIEAVDVPATFKFYQQLITPDRVIANIDVRGVKANLHLETLRSQNIAIAMRLMDAVSTPVLLKAVRVGKLSPGRFITHRFRSDDILITCDTPHNATRTQAPGVITSA